MIPTSFAVLFGALILIFYIFYAIIKKLQIEKIFLTSAIIIYLAAVVCVTLFPIKLHSPAVYFGEYMCYNIKPFFTIKNMLRTDTKYMIYQILGNVFLTVPYGIFVMVSKEKCSIIGLIFIAVLFPACIESTQMLVGVTIGNIYRIIDIDDIILNTIGVIIGYLIVLPFIFSKKNKK